jgi:hypothetical protein
VFYFHVQNGSTHIGTDGVELADAAAARAEAVAMIADILRDGEAGDLSHRPLLVWITDEASGLAPFSPTVTARSQVVVI